MVDAHDGNGNRLAALKLELIDLLFKITNYAANLS